MRKIKLDRVANPVGNLRARPSAAARNKNTHTTRTYSTSARGIYCCDPTESFAGGIDHMRYICVCAVRMKKKKTMPDGNNEQEKRRTLT